MDIDMHGITHVIYIYIYFDPKNLSGEKILPSYLHIGVLPQENVYTS